MSGFGFFPAQTTGTFLEDRELSNLVYFPTCLMSETNLSTIDLIITNKSKRFQNTIGVSTGISDFHKMVLTSIKTAIRPKTAQTEIVDRDMNDSTNYALFDKIFENALDKHTPAK